MQEAPPPGGIQIPLGFPTSVDQILQWLFPSAPKAPPPKPSPAPKGETTQKPATPTPATPKTDGQGSTGPTGPTSLPTPQEKPPAAAPQQEPRAVDDNGFVPYNADQQRAGGFAAGVSIGGGSSPPLVVMPDGVGVLVGVGGAVTIATAVSELAVALSTGGGGDSGTSSGGSAASAATGQHASGNGLADLSKLRAELGAKPGEGAVARLDVAGRSFYGINAHGQPVAPLRINAISATHAEADVFAQAARAGVKGGPGKLFVDRPLCASCGTFGGVRSMARQLGLESLEVVTPNGTFVITP